MKVDFMAEERRRYQRINTVNLLSYVSLDENGKPLDQGMGKTLNISQGGLLLETKVPINAQYVLIMALDIRDELIKIRGQVVYCRETDPRTFHTGVRFKEANERVREIVVELVRVFNMQRAR
jgi:hypothetical protein